ncbi:MAG: hypothetical protein OXN15_06855, partial [Chloroflexota bacterium]|nr:hypothetical protein [Chloroflexota bacterium]
MRVRTKHPAWLFLVIAALGAALLSFAACGSDDGSAAPEVETAMEQTTTAAPVDTPIAAVVAAPETSAPVVEPTQAPETMAMTDPKVKRLVFGTNMPQETTSPPLGGGGIPGFNSMRPMYEFLEE